MELRKKEVDMSLKNKGLGIEGEYEGIGNCIIGYEDLPPKVQKPRKEGYVTFVK